MTREEKILTAIDKGITCNPDTGEVFGILGRVIKTKLNGYIDIQFSYNKKINHLYAHQFIYYCVHKKVVDCIDHKNRIRNDNRIENLRSVSKQQNRFNTNANGCYLIEKNNKWFSRITIDNEITHLGCFKTEQEAHQSYLEAKKKYHQI